MAWFFKIGFLDTLGIHQHPFLSSCYFCIQKLPESKGQPKYPNPLLAYDTQKKNKTKKEQGEIGEKARESLSWDFEINHFFA